MLPSFFGWGTGIRTPEMSESESDALPLGDAPIFSTDDIIADNLGFVNRFFEKSWNFFKIFFRGKQDFRKGDPPPDWGTGLVFPRHGLFNQLSPRIFCGVVPDHLQKVAEDVLQETSRLEAEGNEVGAVDIQIRDTDGLVFLYGGLHQTDQGVGLGGVLLAGAADGEGGEGQFSQGVPPLTGLLGGCLHLHGGGAGEGQDILAHRIGQAESRQIFLHLGIVLAPHKTSHAGGEVGREGGEPSRAHGGDAAGEDVGQKPCVGQQGNTSLGLGGGEDLLELLADPLPGDAGQPLGAAADGGVGMLLNGKAQLDGEAHAPHEAQGVLGEAGVGVAYGADDAAFQVVLSAEQVKDGQGITVLGEPRDKSTHIWTPYL